MAAGSLSARFHVIGNVGLVAIARTLILVPYFKSSYCHLFEDQTHLQMPDLMSCWDLITWLSARIVAPTMIADNMPFWLDNIEGILPKGPYLPCVSMTGRALLAGYHQYGECTLSPANRGGGDHRIVPLVCLWVLPMCPSVTGFHTFAG